MSLRARCLRSPGLPLLLMVACAGGSAKDKPWEETNPVRPLPEPPLGLHTTFDELPEPPTPARVRLGRWLFHDTRLSSDGSVSCATCHQSAYGFSQPTPNATGVDGQAGTRKTPPIINLAWTLYPHFFWDGRAGSLEAQAEGPMTSPIEMAMTHESIVSAVSRVEGYGPYFEEAFGTPEITMARVTKAIADYERTLMSGDSAWDRWRETRDESIVSEAVRQGHALFFGRAACNQCHLNQSFTDNRFHNVGIGWNPETRTFSDPGRFTISGDPADLGAFKTPTLRDVSKRAPYMHDGSLPTLRDVVAHYNTGGRKNPNLSPRLAPLGLTDPEQQALVAFLQALDGGGPEEVPPSAFPR